MCPNNRLFKKIKFKDYLIRDKRYLDDYEEKVISEKILFEVQLSLNAYVL